MMRGNNIKESGMSTQVKRFFFYKNRYNIMIDLGKHDSTTISQTAKRLGLLTNDVCKIMTFLQSQGILQKTQKGRTKIIKLTPYGRKLADIFSAI